MKKLNLKNQKGITIVVLIITLIVLGILAGVAITNVDIGTDVRNYNYMCADIELIENKLKVYYGKYDKLPIKGEVITEAKETLGGQATSRDNDNYYEIDLNELHGMTLNFGGGTNENKDIYIVNEQSLEVYYLKGVVYEGNTYYKKVINN